MENNENYSENGFWKTVKKYAEILGLEGLYNALILYYTLQKPDLPATSRVIIIGALAYLISPLDLIPDVIPVVGLTDDLAALAGAIVTVSVHITPEIKQQARKKLCDWFEYTEEELAEKLKF